MLQDTIQDVFDEFSQSTFAKVIVVAILALGILIGFISLSGASEEQACINDLGGEYIEGICKAPTGEEDLAKNILLVTGNTANSPKPYIDIESESDVYNFFKNSILEYGSINIKMISAAEDKSSTTIKMNNSKSSGVDGQKKTIEGTIERINEKISMAPTSGGANYFEAIVKAGRAAASYKNADESVVLVFGSGLSDSGIINFAKDNLLSKSASDIIATMNKAEQLEGEYLDGVRIKWYGIGQTTKPQEGLSPADIEKIKSIYKLAFSKLGASIEFYDNLAQSESVQNNKYTVEVTPIPGGVIFPPIDFDEEKLSFVQNGTQFLNQNQAENSLSNIIEKAKANPNTKLVITGYMAAGNCNPSSPNKPGLSRGRAETVKNFLIEKGVTNTIEVVDGGVLDSDSSECINNVWKSERANYRRRVIIEFK